MMEKLLIVVRKVAQDLSLRHNASPLAVSSRAAQTQRARQSTKEGLFGRNGAKPVCLQV